MNSCDQYWFSTTLHYTLQYVQQSCDDTTLQTVWDTIWLRKLVVTIRYVMSWVVMHNVDWSSLVSPSLHYTVTVTIRIEMRYLENGWVCGILSDDMWWSVKSKETNNNNNTGIIRGTLLVVNTIRYALPLHSCGKSENLVRSVLDTVVGWNRELTIEHNQWTSWTTALW